MPTISADRPRPRARPVAHTSPCADSRDRLAASRRPRSLSPPLPITANVASRSRIAVCAVYRRQAYASLRSIHESDGPLSRSSQTAAAHRACFPRASQAERIACCRCLVADVSNMVRASAGRAALVSTSSDDDCRRPVPAVTACLRIPVEPSLSGCLGSGRGWPRSSARSRSSNAAARIGSPANVARVRE